MYALTRFFLPSTPVQSTNSSSPFIDESDTDFNKLLLSMERADSKLAQNPPNDVCSGLHEFMQNYPQAFAYALKIAEKKFSPKKDLFSYLTELAKIPPSTFQENRAAPFLKQHAFQTLLDAILQLGVSFFSLGENDAVFHFFSLFQANELFETTLQWRNNKTVEERDKVVHPLLKAITEYGAGSKTSCESLQLFCTFILLLETDQHLDKGIHNYFSAVDQKERKFLDTYFSQLKKAGLEGHERLFFVLNVVKRFPSFDIDTTQNLFVRCAQAVEQNIQIEKADGLFIHQPFSIPLPLKGFEGQEVQPYAQIQENKNPSLYFRKISNNSDSSTKKVTLACLTRLMRKVEGRGQSNTPCSLEPRESALKSQIYDQIKKLNGRDLTQQVRASSLLQSLAASFDNRQMVALFTDIARFFSAGGLPEEIFSLLLNKIESLLAPAKTICPIQVGRLSKLFGASLFAKDHLADLFESKKWTNFEQVEESITKAVQGLLQSIYDQFHPDNVMREETNFSNGFFHDPRSLADAKISTTYYEQRYAAQISHLLFDDLGHLNPYLIDDAIFYLFPRENQSEFDIHAIEILRQFKESDQLSEILNSATVPDKQNSVGEWAIRSTLLLERDKAIFPCDVRKTILATALSCWKQHQYSSCTITSTYLALESNALPWVCQDFLDILKQGKIMRGEGAVKYPYPAVAKTCPWVFGLILGSPLSSAHQIAKAIFEFCDFRYSFSLLGINHAALEKMITFLMKRNQPVTLQAIFAEIQERDGVDQAQLQFARFVIGSVFETSLIRLWENSTMGLFVPPLQEFAEKNEIGKLFATTIMKTFYEVTKERRVDKLNKSFSSALPEAFLKIQPDSSASSKAAVLKAVPAVEVFNHSLNCAVVSALSKFRIFVEPGSHPEDEDVHCCIWIEEESGFRKIENESQFDAVLREALQTIADSILTPSESRQFFQSLKPNQFSRIAMKNFTLFDAEVGVKPQDFPWDFSWFYIGPPKIFSHALACKGTKKEWFYDEVIPFFSQGRPSCDVAKYLENLTEKFGGDSSLKLPAFLVEHAFCVCPNLSFTRTKGENFYGWIAEKEKSGSKLLLNECPITEQKIDQWAKQQYDRLSESQKMQMSQRFFQKSLPVKSPQNKTLHFYINEVFNEMNKLVKGGLSQKAIEKLHLAYFEGLFQDNPHLWKEMMLCFGDSQWQRDVGKRKLPQKYYLYFDPLKKIWNCALHVPEESIVFIQDKGEFPTLDTFAQVEILQKPFKEKRLHVVRSQTRSRLQEIGEKFEKTFVALELGVKELSSHESKSLREILSSNADLQELKLEILALKAQTSSASFQKVADLMCDLMVQKEKQQEIVDDLFLKQEPPVHQLLDLLSPYTQAMGEAGEGFRAKLLKSV